MQMSCRMPMKKTSRLSCGEWRKLPASHAFRRLRCQPSREQNRVSERDQRQMWLAAVNGGFLDRTERHRSEADPLAPCYSRCFSSTHLEPRLVECLAA